MSQNNNELDINKQEDKLNEYYKWYEQTYAKIINLDKLKKYADDNQISWIKELVINFNYKYSSIWRHEVLNCFRYYIIPKKTEYLCCSFKIIREGSSSIKPDKNKLYSTIYAILYVIYDDNEDFQFENVSISSTFKSADGEYRANFLPFSQIMYYYEKYVNLFDFIEKYTVRQLKNKNIHFELNYIIPPIYKNQANIIKKLNKEINEKRLTIVFYNILILYFSRHIFNNNINDEFAESIHSIDQNNINNDINNFIDVNNLDKYYRILNNFTLFKKIPTQNIVVTTTGQKFIPLTINDIEHIQDIKSRPWRELYFSNLVGDLVINGISPSFPIFNNWFLIQGNDKNFWDNKVSKIKLDHSEISSDIIKKLENARKGTFIMDPIKKKELYLSFNMEGFSQAINIPIDYAENELILADIILCLLTEHIGHTMADMPSLLYYAGNKKVYGSIFKKSAYFNKHLFEYLYSIYTMNIKLGMIHGDLHLNNITLFHKRYSPQVTMNNEVLPSFSIVYNILNKFYLFLHSGYYSGIIDCSRAMMNKENLLKHHSEKVTNQVIYYQKNRILRSIESEMPDFYQINKINLEIALISNFDQVFYVYQCIDSYKLSRGLIALINVEILGNKEKLEYCGDEKVLKEEILPLLKKVNSISYNYFTTHMINIFNNDYKNPENVNKIIIEECFKMHEISNCKKSLVYDMKLVDYYSAENNIVYNTREYDKFPETVKLDYVVKNKIPGEEFGLKNYENYQKYLKKEKPDEKIKDIEEKYINDKNKRRGLEEVNNKKELNKDIEQFNVKSSEIQDYYFQI